MVWYFKRISNVLYKTVNILNQIMQLVLITEGVTVFSCQTGSSRSQIMCCCRTESWCLMES